MRVFMTGASGHIASAVIPELIRNGHEVVGLARSDVAAETVARLGAEVWRGDLDDIDGLRRAASEADGVIHLAFRHDAMASGDLAGAGATDLAALETFGEALAGTGKPLVGTSGTMMVAGLGRPATEDDFHEEGYRVGSENFVVGLAGRGVRSSVIRLAPMVHSDLDQHGFTHALIGFARQNGFAAYIDDGANRWPAANSYDIGVLYRLALEKAPAGSRLHGTGDNGIPFATIADTIAGRLGIETRSISQDQAAQYLGFLSPFAGLDGPVSNEKTRQVLGWEPTHPGWVEDVKTGSHYFA
jgi:nucleoside-diphosphate-sugar epimerase